MRWLILNPYKKLFLISLLVYIITAYFSIGYYHPDEHFQILEFCNYKLGNSPAIDLPWEFHEKIRPALQPTIAFVLIKIFNALSINNPFTHALILRIFTAILSWFVICKTALLLVDKFSFKIGKTIFLFLSLLLGFIPFINVRFSSETLAGITFLSAIYFVLKLQFQTAKKKQLQLIYIGLLFGFSFFFRYQIAFAILGLVLWLVIINKMRRWDLVIIALSGIIAISMCVLIDYWFYGKFEFTPYNYFIANIVQKRAANFGVEPWWYFFSNFIQRIPTPFGILLLLLFFIGLFKNPKDVFVWCLIPFLLAHFVIAHKEMRFLFPIVFGFTYLSALGIEHIIQILKLQKFGKFIFILIIVINAPSLIYNMLMPADKELYFYKFLYDKSPKRETVLISRDLDFVNQWGLKSNFYNLPNIIFIEMFSDKSIMDLLSKYKPDSLYILTEKNLPEILYKGYNNKCVYTLYPDWGLWFNLRDLERKDSKLSLQELTRIK